MCACARVSCTLDLWGVLCSCASDEDPDEKSSFLAGFVHAGAMQIAREMDARSKVHMHRYSVLVYAFAYDELMTVFACVFCCPSFFLFVVVVWLDILVLLFWESLFFC